MTRSTSPVGPQGLSRRWVLRGLFAGGIAALGGVLTLPGGGLFGSTSRRGVQAATRGMMGTTATILLHGVPRGRAEVAVEAAFGRMEAVAAAMTRYRVESDVGRVNAAQGRPVSVSVATASVVQAALAYARASDGAFDPALDGLTDLWGFHAAVPVARLPAESRLQPWRARHLYRAVQVGGAADAPTLQLADAAAGLDLGGIAKGYAVDLGVAELRRWGVRDALVEAGGDLYALGRDPAGRPWPVGVRHPRDPTRLLGTLQLSNEAAATSGDDSRYFETGGRRYAHLLDPAQGRPAGTVRSLTVRAASAQAADALATAAAVAPWPAGAALLERLGAHQWLVMDSAGQVRAG